MYSDKIVWFLAAFEMIPFDRQCSDIPWVILVNLFLLITILRNIQCNNRSVSGQCMGNDPPRSIDSVVFGKQMFENF